MAEILGYTPQPHTDHVALIRRADALLRQWVEIYGEHQPEWLPPAGIVNWQEDASRYLSLYGVDIFSVIDRAVLEFAAKNGSVAAIEKLASIDAASKTVDAAQPQGNGGANG